MAAPFIFKGSKRFLFVVAGTVALLLVPGTAFAQEANGGCQEFGQAVAGFAQSIDDFGGLISGLAPVSDQVATDQRIWCG